MQPFRYSDMNMLTVNNAASLREIVSRWKTQGLKVGFVPTMGALHEGHLSLVDLALKNSDRVVTSIFVNPTQFAPHEDFNSYPREEAKDLKKLQDASVHLAYVPPESEIYPENKDTNIRPGPAAEGLESDFRPHFFGGVVNVVYRLFDQVKPDIAVFGEKDFQQLQVIREMVEAQHLPIKILGGEIVRDSEGLALSSRNAYLSKDQLKIARMLNKVLFAGGDTDSMKEKLLASGFDKVDYVAERWNRRLAAAWIGKTRLIDNVNTKNTET